MILGNFVESKAEIIYLVSRVIFGALFLLHGLAKFGIPAGEPATDMLFMVAGAVEVLAGIGLITGFLTRLSALGGAIVMIGALAMFHLPAGLNPLTNGGELAFLYLGFFITVLAYGSGKFGLEKKFLGKEIF